MRKLLKLIAPGMFLNGLDKCNKLGMDIIARHDNTSMLDVGCGDGTLTLQFAETGGIQEIHGIEIVDSLRAEAERKGIRCTAQDLNAPWKYDSGSFDLILSSQNIEHLHNTRLYLQECLRCLRIGGQLIVLTENLASWANIGALVLGWQPFSTTNINGLSVGNPLIWHLDEPRDTEFFDTWQSTGISGTVGHVRVLSYMGLRDLMEEVGFRNIRMHTRGWFPLWGLASDIMCTLDRRHGHFLIATGFKKGDVFTKIRRPDQT